MTLTVAYDGMVHTPHLTWPFDPAPIGNIIANAIANALGNLRAHDMENQAPGFDLFLTQPEGTYIPREQVFVDFSNLAPPHNITSRPPELPPWNNRTQHTPEGVCQGRSCAYPPAPTNNHPSGCDIAWKRYAQTLAKAFTDANPPIEFRTAPPQCILDVTDPDHRCNQACRFGLRDHPLDHDELCRLPDGRLFILSHPYPQGTDDTFTANLDAWQQHVPDLTIRPTSAARSWYLPNRSVLVAVGERTTLDQLNLHYTVPHGDEPFGCARWTGAREQDPSP